MRFLSFVALSALFLTSACGYTTVRSAPNFERTLQEHSRSGNSMIATLPPEVIVIEHSMDGSKRLDQYEYGLEDILSNQIISVLEQKGYRARNLRRAMIHKQGELRNYDDLRQTYNSNIRSLYSGSSHAKEEVAFDTHVNLGEKALQIGKVSNYDLLLFIDFSGEVPSAGKQVMDTTMGILFGGGGQYYRSTLQVGLVDAKTGELLWANQIPDLNGISIKGDAQAQEKQDNQYLKEQAELLFSGLPDKDKLNQPKSK